MSTFRMLLHSLCLVLYNILRGEANNVVTGFTDYSEGTM